MSYADVPVLTDTEKILAAEAETQERLQKLTDAVNGMGANLQWIVDNAQNIFQMFSNPAFMSMLPSMMSGGAPDAEERGN